MFESPLIYKTLYNSLGDDFTKAWMTNLIRNVKDLSNVNEIRAIAGYPYMFSDLSSAEIQISNHALQAFNIELTGNMSKKAAKLLMKNRKIAFDSLPTSSEQASQAASGAAAPTGWKNNRDYRLGERAINQQQLYEVIKVDTGSFPRQPPRLLSTLWRLVPSGGYRQRTRKASKRTRKAKKTRKASKTRKTKKSKKASRR
jgi:hypothetical protein